MQMNAHLIKSPMPFVVGAVLDICGKVQKVVKRDEQCKLVIQPGDALAFTVFADCLNDAEEIQSRKIQKGSLVSIRGKFQTYGAMAVCLEDCCLQ